MHFSSNKSFLIVYTVLLLCTIIKSAEQEQNTNIDKNQAIINNTITTNKNATVTTVKIKNNETINTTEPEVKQSSNMQNLLHTDDDEVPNSIRVGFYIFIGLGVLSIFFIIFRTYRMRLSRAERRYGVQGDRGAQELTPLPMAIEDDSENDDQTLFEINRQTRVS